MKPQHPSKTRRVRNILRLEGEPRGLNSHRVLRSVGEVAAMLGVSRQAVHQVERAALHKLRIKLLPHLREISPEMAADFERRLHAH